MTSAGITSGPSPSRPPGFRRRLWITIGVAVALILFFLGMWLNLHYTLPDAHEPTVKADAARAARVLEAHYSPILGPTVCTTRVLGHAGSALLVHGDCVSVRTDRSVASGPARIATDGDVRIARPGPSWDTDVKELLGFRLGNWYLNHEGSFSPPVG